MILTVTPNPSVDKALLVPGFQLGRIHRPQQVVNVAGGKGLNVTRTIHSLGGEVEACLLLAGHSGHWIEEQLLSAGIPLHTAWYPGETRTSISISDPLSGRLTEIYESGSPITSEAWEAFAAAFINALPPAGWVALSGSLPPGAPVDGYARLLDLAHRQDLPTLIDTRGDFLRAIIPHNPWLVKVNSEEAGELVGQEVASLDEALGAAQELRRAGPQYAIVTLGKQGAATAGPDGAWIGTPPPVKTIAPVGSGDAMLGGLVLGLSQELPFAEAFRLGLAAGAANAASLGAGVVNPQLVKELLPQVALRSG